MNIIHVNRLPPQVDKLRGDTGQYLVTVVTSIVALSKR